MQKGGTCACSFHANPMHGVDRRAFHSLYLTMSPLLCWSSFYQVIRWPCLYDWQFNSCCTWRSVVGETQAVDHGPPEASAFPSSSSSSDFRPTPEGAGGPRVTWSGGTRAVSQLRCLSSRFKFSAENAFKPLIWFPFFVCFLFLFRTDCFYINSHSDRLCYVWVSFNFVPCSTLCHTFLGMSAVWLCSMPF